MIFTTLEVLLILAYVVLANSWAIFAITMNNLFHHEEPSIWQIVACYVYNVIGFPVALWIAAFNTTTGRFDHLIKPPGCDEKVNNLSSKLNDANIEIKDLKRKLFNSQAENPIEDSRS